MEANRIQAAKRNRRIAYFGDRAVVGLLLLAALVLGAAYFVVSPPPTIHISANAGQYPDSAAAQAAMRQKEQAMAQAKPLTPYNSDVKLPPDPAYKLVWPDGAMNFDGRPADFHAHAIEDIGVAGIKGTGVAAWQGERDHSLRAWVGHDKDYLVIRADVTDDEHIQRHGDVSPYDMFRDDCLQIAFIAGDWKSQWEFGFARSSSGKLLRICWISPELGRFRFLPLKDQVPPEAAEKLEQFIADIDVNIDPMPGGMRYVIRIPLVGAGLTPELLHAGVRINVSSPDTDDSMNPQESWIEITDGIMAHKEPNRFAEIKFDQ